MTIDPLFAHAILPVLRARGIRYDVAAPRHAVLRLPLRPDAYRADVYVHERDGVLLVEVQGLTAARGQPAVRRRLEQLVHALNGSVLTLGKVWIDADHADVGFGVAVPLDERGLEADAFDRLFGQVHAWAEHLVWALNAVRYTPVAVADVVQELRRHAPTIPRPSPPRATTRPRSFIEAEADAIVRQRDRDQGAPDETA